MLVEVKHLRLDQPTYYIGDKVKVKPLKWFESNCKQDETGNFLIRVHKGDKGEFDILMPRFIVERYADTIQTISSLQKYIIPGYKDIRVYKFENSYFDWWYTDVFDFESSE
jgi:hypothetical protein